MRKKKLKKEYFAPWCTITMVQAECPLLTGSIHVTVNENSSNEQSWDNDNRFEGTPHKNGSNPDDSWFGTTSEVAP